METNFVLIGPSVCDGPALRRASLGRVTEGDGPAVWKVGTSYFVINLKSFKREYLNLLAKSFSRLFWWLRWLSLENVNFNLV